MSNLVPTSVSAPRYSGTDGFSCGNCKASILQTDLQCPSCGTHFVADLDWYSGRNLPEDGFKVPHSVMEEESERGGSQPFFTGTWSMPKSGPTESARSLQNHQNRDLTHEDKTCGFCLADVPAGATACRGCGAHYVHTKRLGVRAEAAYPIMVCLVVSLVGGSMMVGGWMDKPKIMNMILVGSLLLGGGVFGLYQIFKPRPRGEWQRW
jgi:hypothetical protein